MAELVGERCHASLAEPHMVDNHRVISPDAMLVGLLTRMLN